jgi:hypothetical protein
MYKLHVSFMQVAIFLGKVRYVPEDVPYCIYYENIWLAKQIAVCPDRLYVINPNECTYKSIW